MTSLVADWHDHGLDLLPWQLSGNLSRNEILRRDTPKPDQLFGASSTEPEQFVVISTQIGENARQARVPLDAYEGFVTSVSPALVSKRQPSHRPDIAEMLATIRAAFCLSISSLARVMRVQRPTIYSWMRHEVEPRSRSLQRLRAVWWLADLWLALAKRPLRDEASIPVVDDRSLMDLLSDEPLRGQVIEEHLRRFAREPGLGQPKGRGGRHAAEMVGREGPVPGADERISFETGRRTVQE